MLPKIICVLLVVRLVDVAYQDEEPTSSYGHYKEDADEDIEPLTVRRYVAKRTVKTLSPREIQAVRGAIKQMLSGHKQDRLFSPMPSNENFEKRSIKDKRLHEPVTDDSYDSRQMRTKNTYFAEHTSETKFESTTLTTTESENDISSLNDDVDENYETNEFNARIPTRSLIPLRFGGIAHADETTKENYQTETNEEVIGATEAILTRATLLSTFRIDDILSNTEGSTKEDYQTDANDEISTIGATPTRSSFPIVFTFQRTITDEATKETTDANDFIGTRHNYDLSSTDDSSPVDYQTEANKLERTGPDSARMAITGEIKDNEVKVTEAKYFGTKRPGAKQIELKTNLNDAVVKDTALRDTEENDEEKDTEDKDIEVKESEEKETDSKETEAKETDSKETESKETEVQETEAKEPEAEETEPKEPELDETEVKETDPKKPELEETEVKEIEPKEPELEDTEVKETEAKETEAKETEVQETESKDTEAKETEVKETESKDTEAKETKVKETGAKETEAKDTNAKDTEAKDTEAKDTGKIESEAKVSKLEKAKTTKSNKVIKTTKTTTTTTTTKRTTKFQLDVPALLEIIANLTYDYEMNLTDNLNETLLRLSIPTCETPTTTEKIRDFIDYDANATGTIVAKCFVCGLEEEAVPRHAQCADAFAGDFLPLVPVDMTARGRISKYRKYCRYLDVPHYLVNASMPRSVYGRWTGGCSVRWIDLSGIYTQRSCRNRNRAIMGRHYASKRMAKLEMALTSLNEGCISSPMATLVPLSRGISLYARFHACVCTGSWCNHAPSHTHWLPTLAPVLLVQVNALSPVMMS